MNDYNRTFNYSPTREYVDMTEAFPRLMRSVYGWMCAGLAITALAALVVAKSPEMIFAIAQNSALLWGLLIAEIGLVVFLSARIHKMSFSTASLCFAAYALLNGVTMSFLFFAYTMESIVSTFAITAGTFGAMSLVGFVIKKDLSAMGRIFLMLLIGLIIATVVNMFVGSTGMAMVINYLGVILFVGLTAYDTQKIKEMLQQAAEAGVSDQTQKLALMGSLTLYLDFINLFLYLLRFLGDRK